MIDTTEFEKVRVGETREFSKKITLDDVKNFAQLTGDDNPLHLNSEFASRTSFKEIVVHGMLGASFISTVIGTKLPGPGALWVKQSFEFLLPVRIGDELKISCRVLKKHARDRLLDLEANIYNQNNSLVLSGVGQVKMLEVLAPPSEVAPKTNKPRVALVTGGSGGIGSKICKRLAQDGIKVIVHYNQNKQQADRVVAEIEGFDGTATAIGSDLSFKDGAVELVENARRIFGKIDILVNNASPKIMPSSFLQTEWKQIQFQIDTQLRSTFLLMKECAIDMQSTGKGRIVSITSQVTRETPSTNWIGYVLSKTALNTLSKQLAYEIGHAGITVNCVAPGMTDTSLIGDIPQKQQMIIARQTPLRRLAEPSDVSDAVAFLISDDAKYITGHTLDVNGGKVMS